MKATSFLWKKVCANFGFSSMGLMCFSEVGLEKLVWPPCGSPLGGGHVSTLAAIVEFVGHPPYIGLSQYLFSLLDKPIDLFSLRNEVEP